MNTKTFLMMGRPGSGKGTQAKLLSEKIGARVYSSGTYFRAVAQQDTFLGRKVRGLIDNGILLPSWFSSFLFVQELVSLGQEQPIIFEGACRDEVEAITFDEATGWLERPYGAIYLAIGESEVAERLTKRSGVEGRADDTQGSFAERMEEYKNKTARAVEFFRDKGTLIEINGEQTVEQVHQDILKALKLL